MTRNEEYLKAVETLIAYLQKHPSTVRQLATRFKLSIPSMHARLGAAQFHSGKVHSFLGKRAKGKTGPTPVIYAVKP